MAVHLVQQAGGKGVALLGGLHPPPQDRAGPRSPRPAARHARTRLRRSGEAGGPCQSVPGAAQHKRPRRRHPAAGARAAHRAAHGRAGGRVRASRGRRHGAPASRALGWRRGAGGLGGTGGAAGAHRGPGGGQRRPARRPCTAVGASARARAGGLESGGGVDGRRGAAGLGEWHVGPPDMEAEAEEDACHHEELGKQWGRYPDAVLLHGDARRRLSRMRSLPHYPLPTGT
jgi:hypothetical protein